MKKKSLRKKSVKGSSLIVALPMIFYTPKHFGLLGFTLVFCVYCGGKIKMAIEDFVSGRL